MNNWRTDFQNSPSNGHIYVNGFGFVNTDPRLQEGRGIRKNASVTGLVLVLILVLSFFGPYIAAVLINEFLQFMPAISDYTFNLTLIEMRELLSYTASMGIPLVLAALVLRPHRGSASPYQMPSDWALFTYYMVFALAATVLLSLMTDGMERILADFHVLELTPDYLLPAAPAALVLYLIRLSVLPALLEELLFRGILLRSFRQFGDAFALVASSVSFGLIHYTMSKDINGFILGMILGYCVIRTGSVFTAICGRFLTLLLPLTLRMVQHIAGGATYRIVLYVLYIFILAIAVGVFVLVCRRESNAFILSKGNTDIPISLKLRGFFLNISMILAAILWILQIFRHIHIIG